MNEVKEEVLELEEKFDGPQPANWKLVRLAEIAEIGPKIPNRDQISDDSEVQFLPMKLVEEENGKIHLSETRTYGEVKKGYTPFVDGDVIFAKVTPCMENGKIALVDNLKNGIGFGSSEFHVIRSKGEALGQYLFYYLVQKRFRMEAEAEMTGAVGLRRVPKKYLEDYPIPLPPLPEQQAIVARIEELFRALDKGKQQLEEVRQQLKVYRQAVLKWAFEGKLTNGTVCEDKLPDGWEWKNIGQITLNLDGKRIPLSKVVRSNRKGTYRYYGATEVVDYIDDFIFDGTYLLIGEDGANLLSKTKPLAFIAEGKFWVNNHAHVLQPKPGLNLYYLCHYINSLNLQEFVSGTAQPKLTQANLNRINVPFPEQDHQDLIVQEIESRISVCDKMEETIERSLLQAETLRQSILKKAFEGKLA